MFGERIAAARAQRGWSQRELARQSDCSREYVRRLEAGTVTATGPSVAKLLRALKLGGDAWIDALLEGRLPRRVSQAEATALAWLLGKKGATFLSDIAKVAEEALYAE